MTISLLEEIGPKCRFCQGKGKFFEVITLHNFPKAAQFLPSVDEFDQDLPIDLKVIECNFCGLVQLDNEPVSYFREVITAASLNDSSKKILKEEFGKIVRKFSLDRAKALEIGAGTGDFLLVLQQLGLDAVGLEYGESNVHKAKTKGVNLIKGCLLEKPKIEHNYKFIVCNNYLEHQPDIRAFLNRMNESLVSDGYIYISVPNLDRIFQKGCFYEFVTDHLVYFSKKTLIRVIEMSGFNVEECYLKNNRNDIVVVAKKRHPRDLDGKKEKMAEIVKSLHRKVEDLTRMGKKVSIWGAGHRALALMALSDVDKINFVIDSAPFKQGKYTPRLRKKIVSPNDFFSNERCDCVIVMLPGSLSGQVKSYLESIEYKGKVVFFEDQVLR